MKITLTGNNSYLVKKRFSDLVSNWRLQHGDSIERFEADMLSSADEIIDAVRSVAMFDPQKMVTVKDYSQNSNVADKIETIVQQCADSTDLVLVDASLDKRTKLYTFLKNNTELETFEETSGANLASWVIEQMKAQDCTITLPVARSFIERVGPHQELLATEMKKLGLVKQEITQELIDKMVEPTPQSKVFALLETLFNGNLRRTMQLYRDQRLQGEEPQRILAMIIWQLQQLTLAVFAPQKTTGVLTAAGMSSYSAQKTLQLAKRISSDALTQYVSSLSEIDRASKTGADIESALIVYFSEVTYSHSQQVTS